MVHLVLWHHVLVRCSRLWLRLKLLRVATCDHRYRDWSILSLCFPSIHPPVFWSRQFWSRRASDDPTLTTQQPTYLAQLKGFTMQKFTQKKRWKSIPWWPNHPTKNRQCFCPWILPQFTHPSISEGKRWKRVWNRTSKATRCWSRFLFEKNGWDSGISTFFFWSVFFWWTCDSFGARQLFATHIDAQC